MCISCNSAGVSDAQPGPEAVVNWLVDNPNIQIPPDVSDVESNSSYDNCSDSDLNIDDEFEDLETDYEQVRLLKSSVDFLLWLEVTLPFQILLIILPFYS